MSEFFPELRHSENPIIFFEIYQQDLILGTIKFELFSDTCPKVNINRQWNFLESYAQENFL